MEWLTSSPPPEGNFSYQPQVFGSPYDYGVPGSIHAVTGIAGASDDGSDDGI
jgi:cytochrome c oxidase subunit 1